MTHARNANKPAIGGRALPYALVALVAGFLGALISPHAAMACGLLAVTALGIDMHQHLRVTDQGRRAEP